MSREVRLGILGAGMVATAPGGYLSGMSAVDARARVVAIAAPSAERRDAAAARFGIDGVHGSLEEMLERDDLDAVVNLTPPAMHASTSLRILESGRHLISEKPIAGTLEEADALAQAATDRDLTVVVAPARLVEPQSRRAAELLADGAIGAVSFARIRSSHSGPAAQAWPVDPTWYYDETAGPLREMGVYGIQQVTGLLGRAVRVAAFSGRRTTERVARGGPFDGLPIPVVSDDTSILILDHGEAVFSMIDATFSVRASRAPEVEIFGLDGTIALPNLRLHPDAVPVDVYRSGPDGVHGDWSDARGPDFDTRQELVRRMGRALLVEHLLACLDGETNQLGLVEARHTLQVMLAAERSAREGAVVDIA